MRGLQPNAMRGLQPRSFILLPSAIVLTATGDTIQLRNPSVNSGQVSQSVPV